MADFDTIDEKLTVLTLSFNRSEVQEDLVVSNDDGWTIRIGAGKCTKYSALYCYRTKKCGFFGLHCCRISNFSSGGLQKAWRT